MHHVGHIDWSFADHPVARQRDLVRAGPAAHRRAGAGRRPHGPRRRRAPARRLARAARPQLRGGALRPRGRAAARARPAASTGSSAGDYALMPTGVRHALGNSTRTAPVRLLVARRRRSGWRRTPDRQGHVLRARPGPRRDGRRGPPTGVRRPDAAPRRPLRRDRAAARDAAHQGRGARAGRSAGRDTALVVYSGISVKMLVDHGFGADHVTMFTVDYEPGGAAQAHDHPFEEAYVFLAGEVEAEFDGQHYTSGPVTSRSRGVGLGPRLLQHRHRAGPLDRDPGAAAAGSPLLSLGARLGALRDHATRRRPGDRTGQDGAVVVVGGTRAIGLGDRPALRRRRATTVDPHRPGPGECRSARPPRSAARRRVGRSTWPSRTRSRRRSPTSGRSAASCWPRSTATRTRSPTTTSPRRSSS